MIFRTVNSQLRSQLSAIFQNRFQSPETRPNPTNDILTDSMPVFDTDLANRQDFQMMKTGRCSLEHCVHCGRFMTFPCNDSWFINLHSITSSILCSQGNSCLRQYRPPWIGTGINRYETTTIRKIYESRVFSFQQYFTPRALRFIPENACQSKSTQKLTDQTAFGCRWCLARTIAQ